MNFADVKAITIPEGKVKRILSGSSVLWQAPASYVNLVPTAIGTDGEILDGIGYRRGVAWNGTAFTNRSAFTSIGLIPIDGAAAHEIFVYGIDFTGTSYNRYILFSAEMGTLNSSYSLKEGFSSTLISSVIKLGDYYYKITTAKYSTSVKYFALSGVTVSGLEPIVTMDEEIL
jgi:hypothetical protein